MLIEELKHIDENDKLSGIYALYNRKTCKIYVGSSINVYHRTYDEHLKSLNENKHYNKYLQSAYNIDSEHFLILLLEVVSDKDKLIEREQYWIDSFMSFKSENGYNLTPTAGSMLGFKHSEETRKLISQSQTGRTQSEESKKKKSESLKGENCYWFGKKLSKEHIDKIQNSRGNYKHNDETKAKISEGLKNRVRKKESYDKIAEKLSISVSQYSKDGKFIREWNSIAEAAKSLNINRSNISLALKGKRESSGGFKWKYKDEIEVGK